MTSLSPRAVSAGIPASTSITSYLPAYWRQGRNVSKITFTNLLTHTSGLTSEDPSFESMKSSIASDVTVGGYQYANVNFSLCRILLSVLNGNVAANFETGLADLFGGMFAAFVDVTWDLVTITVFQQYVAANVFSPSASGAHVVHQPTDALAYDFPTSAGEIGWDDGDLATWSGAAAWHMSVNQLLSIMGTFRRGGTIVSSQQAQTMLDNGFGIDWTVGTSAGGSYYAKNGLFWTASSNNSWQTEQGVAFYLPEDMELVVLVNSPVGVVPNSTPPPLTFGEFLYSVVSDVYEANLA